MVTRLEWSFEVALIWIRVCETEACWRVDGFIGWKATLGERSCLLDVIEMAEGVANLAAVATNSDCLNAGWESF